MLPFHTPFHRNPPWSQEKTLVSGELSRKQSSKISFKGLAVSTSFSVYLNLDRQASELSCKFDKQLHASWGLDSLLTVGESWLPSILDQV